MIQHVKATDRYQSQLFQWDAVQKVLSLPHGKEIWFARLGCDGKFTVFKRIPKPRNNPMLNDS